ncbi:unnamed protein product [Schistocephalus solidus]|uniref:SET domain-containing protein n=1 Tax=Schistocephalus solidus TaxID=70667 RepID=A0A183SWW4_SCHSO|nr:unnamed protein product [Schistocephalus solidus]
MPASHVFSVKAAGGFVVVVVVVAAVASVTLANMSTASQPTDHPHLACYSAETAELEVVELPRLLLVDRPVLRSIQQRWQYDNFVHLEFSAELETMSIPDDCIVISEEKFVDGGCLYTRVELYPTLVEESATHPVGDADPGAFVKVGKEESALNAAQVYYHFELSHAQVAVPEPTCFGAYGGPRRNRRSNYRDARDEEAGAAAGDLVYVYYVHDLAPQTQAPGFHTTGG